MKTKEENFRDEIAKSENVIKVESKKQRQYVTLAILITIFAIKALFIFNWYIAIPFLVINLFLYKKYQDSRDVYVVEHAVLSMLKVGQGKFSDY